MSITVLSEFFESLMIIIIINNNSSELFNLRGLWESSELAIGIRSVLGGLCPLTL